MNPFHTILITLGYLLFVVVGLTWLKIFPRFHLPFVKFFQFFYNLFLIILSFWIAAESIYQAFVINDYGLVGNPNSQNDPKLIGLARIMWVFYFSKIIEMADTLFMIVRNNPRQVTFLHVFHHSSIFFIWWFVIYYGPGGDSIYSVIINSIIHVVMYFYYTCATIGLSWGPLKNLLTITQMIQFIWMIVHSSIIIFIDDRNSHRFLVWTLIIYSLVLFVLFMNFFLRSKAEARARSKSSNLDESKSTKSQSQKKID